MSKHKPFPWFLKFPAKPVKNQEYRLSVISQQSLGVESVVADFMWNMVNPANDHIEPVYHSYIVKEVLETRLSRGDWTNYEGVPFFYDLIAICQGYCFESELNPAENGVSAY